MLRHLQGLETGNFLRPAFFSAGCGWRRHGAPDALALGGLVQAGDGGVVGGQFVGAGAEEDDFGQGHDFQRGAIGGHFHLFFHAQAVLAPRHGQVNIGQQFRIQQCAVQLAVGVRDAVAVAQGVERVALAGMHFLRLHQRIDHAVDLLVHGRQVQALEFRVQEADVERGIVDDQFGAGDIGAKFIGDFREFRLVAEEFRRQAVDGQRALFRIALGIDVVVKIIPGQHAVVQFDSADLQDAVARTRVQAGGFSIENNLTHGRFSLKSKKRRAQYSKPVCCRNRTQTCSTAQQNRSERQ